MARLPSFVGKTSPLGYALAAPSLPLVQSLRVMLIYCVAGWALTADASFWPLPLRRLAVMPMLPVMNGEQRPASAYLPLNGSERALTARLFCIWNTCEASQSTYQSRRESQGGPQNGSRPSLHADALQSHRHAQARREIPPQQFMMICRAPTSRDDGRGHRRTV